MVAEEEVMSSDASALALLSLQIGMIMEDHSAAAVLGEWSTLEEGREHFARLHQAGSDILALAHAAEVVLRVQERR